MSVDKLFQKMRDDFFGPNSIFKNNCCFSELEHPDFVCSKKEHCCKNNDPCYHGVTDEIGGKA